MERISAKCCYTHIPQRYYSTDNIIGFITVRTVLMVFSRQLLHSSVHYGPNIEPNIYCFLTV